MTLRRDECEYHIPGSGIDLSQERLSRQRRKSNLSKMGEAVV